MAVTVDDQVIEKLYYEDFIPGIHFKTGERTITTEDLETFTKLSGDYNPLHTDPEYASTTAFGELIVQGALVLSISTGLAYDLHVLDGTVEAFLGLEWKYRAPVRVGDSIWVDLQFAKKRPMPHYAGGLITLYVTIFNQDHKAVQKGTWTLLMRSKNGASPDAS
jgi:acyl dehydratase